MSSRREFIKQSALAGAGVIVASSSFGNFFIGKKNLRLLLLGPDSQVYLRHIIYIKRKLIL